ncbi:MAG TPA: MgtC/SapB family protein [Syntrophomonas sp.]|nr:MgtC/SapB family protein [Syntrophomonas sp.]HRW11916.1 MgtC/SapB family protein [Syntrophomonas sp.]
MEALEIVFRLALACILGGIVGLERESLNRPAGFRTYTVVCVGSALAMIVSIDMYTQFHHYVTADPGRIAAQVISGIGFLGAGTIMKEGATIRGLTTAAGLWVVACIGLAAGAGMYLAAIVATASILFVLIYFARFEHRFTGMRLYKGIVILVDDQPGQVGIIGSILGDMNVLIKEINLDREETENQLEIELLLQLPPEISIMEVIERLSNIQGLHHIDRLN